MQYEVEIDGRTLPVHIRRIDGHYLVAVDGREWLVDAARVDGHTLSLLIETASHEVAIAPDRASGQLMVHVGGVPVLSALNSRRRWSRKDEGTAGSGPQRIVAPMPGKVARVLVAPGAVVVAGQPLVVIEAMKMENELRASREGTVAELHAQEGQSVDAGALLLVVAPT
jgi:biotin carboxyl carrier protein